MVGILGIYLSGIVYYMVIRLVSLDYTIYLLGVGVFATEAEISHLIGTCIYVHYLRLGHNRYLLQHGPGDDRLHSRQKHLPQVASHLLVLFRQHVDPAPFFLSS